MYSFVTATVEDSTEQAVDNKARELALLLELIPHQRFYMLLLHAISNHCRWWCGTLGTIFGKCHGRSQAVFLNGTKVVFNIPTDIKIQVNSMPDFINQVQSTPLH